MPPTIPRRFVTVVMQHHRYDAVAVLGVERNIVPSCIYWESVVVITMVEEWWLGIENVRGQRAQVRFAILAVEVLDLRFQKLIVAHPRICCLEGDVGPVVEADAELKGLAIEALCVHMCLRWMKNVHYRVALQDLVGIGEVFSEKSLELLCGIEES